MAHFLVRIGFEIHAELRTKTKMYCGCPAAHFGAEPNSLTCPVCLGLPGSLPVPNREAIRQTLLVGLATNCQVVPLSKWDRKSYFYPDLPKGYQISQYDLPLCRAGFVELAGRRIGIRRVHLEEDTGKLLHQEGLAFVDFNRAGVPLIELVSEPELTTTWEAGHFAREIQLLLRTLQVSDADMEKGQMRAEANISVELREEEGEPKGGVKVEIKNLNSFRAVERAIRFEIDRQTKLLEGGQNVIQETRGWDERREATVSQREKEEAYDYRYFPEPDLPPIEPGKLFDLRKLRASLPELPWQRRARLLESGLLPKDVEVIIHNLPMAAYLDRILKSEPSKKILRAFTNLLINVVPDLRLPEGELLEAAKLLAQGRLSSSLVKEVIGRAKESGKTVREVVESEKLKVKGVEDLRKLIEEALHENPKAVADFRAGKVAALHFLAGAVMRKSGGQADPSLVQKVLKERLTFD